ncbi:reverse transcriptase domain-containing protein [Tanacetum coccineum]
MAPKRATRSTPVTTTPAPTATTTTSVTNAQLQAMIDQGVTAALAARDANRNGDDSHTSGTGGRRTERVARECTYQDFMKCKPLYFKGTEGVVELTQWFERIETIFRISNCSVENQIKFSTCTLLAGALTWWNSHVMTVSHDVAYAMTWADLRKKMTDKYCPRNEMKKLEAELWNLKVKGTDVIGYNQHFQELALLCVRMFPEESDKIERLRTKGSLKTLPETIKTNNNRTRGRTLAGLILQGLVKRSHKGDLNPYALNATITTTRGTGSSQKPTCFEYGVQGHFKRECPKLKNNKNHGNQVGNDRAPAKVYAVGHAGTNPDSNVMTGTFLLNNRYASILFDTCADRSFVSTAFSSQIDITPSTLDHYYDVELANGRIIGFDAIIGMDWLAKYQAIIVCAENIVLFLAHVTTKEVEEKSEKKRLEDAPIVQDFPEVFLEDLSGLPPTRKVEFQINLIPGAAPILWGITHRSNIDYAKRIWEEFVQSMQTFLTGRKNLATASRRKKKTAHLLIPNVRYVGNNGREIFGMPIHDAFLTDAIKSAPYYNSYLEHVTEYQRYLNESTISYDNESSDDNNDDDDVEKDEEDKEEKEHLASADPSAVPTDDPVPSS